MEKPTIKHRPIVLAILDGWGYTEAKTDNAIKLANTPNWDQWWREKPHALLECSGLAVGLPPGQMGNSEVGHMHISAGRVLYQDFTKIEHEISTGEFAKNKVWQKMINLANQTSARIHLIGLLSPGGVHSHERHFAALIQLLAQAAIPHVYLHAILDGRDTPPQSAQASLEFCHAALQTLPDGQIATIMGRFFAMDRDERWPRIEQAYDALILGEAPQVHDAFVGLAHAYQLGETDEFVTPKICTANSRIQDGDIVVFMNFRADRARELSRALTQPDFQGFKRKKIVRLGEFITLTDYAQDIEADVVYPPVQIANNFGEYIANLGLTQLRIAETEKYAHVTFFFNGGREQKFQGEDRILIPSPKIATYDLQPEMSAPEITDALIKAIQSQDYDVIIVNFANADMVGHTGNLPASIQAVECLDSCLGRIFAALQTGGGEMFITADHGNIEHLFDEVSGQPSTSHTTNPVPFLYLGRPAKVQAGVHSLIDIAPTLLQCMGLPQPVEMTGHSIFNCQED